MSMAERSAETAAAPQPVAAFRTAILGAAARERAGRARRPERVAAIASLEDGDLVRLVECFERLLRDHGDVATLVARLHYELRSLTPDAPADLEADHA